MKWFQDYHLRRAVLVDKLYRQALFNIPHVFCLCNCHHVWMKQHPIMMLTLSIIQNYKIKVQPLFVLSDIGKNLNETTPLFVSTGVEQSEQY